MKDTIKELNKQVKKPEIVNVSLDDEERLFVFLSLDICNSTKMKSQISNWFEVTQTFYNEMFPLMHFWKYNGDEVLYTEQFTNISNLICIINEAYSFIANMEELLSSVSGISNFKMKGTIWIARTSGDIKCSTQNLHFSINSITNEFMGINIDEGFRLAQKASGNKIVIDPKIVYLLLLIRDIFKDEGQFNIIDEKHPFYLFARNLDKETNNRITEIISKIYFIDYTKLKGVWDNRKYPVFWFCSNGATDFEYDEQLDEKDINSKELHESDISKKIQNVFKSVDAEKEFLRIICLLANYKKTNIYSSESEARLYYTVACVNPNTNHVLVFLRSKNRKHLKNVWEFGSFKHSSLSISKTLEKQYKDSFGIDIEIVTDGEFERNILPMHFCTIYRNGQAHNSVLCFARIKTSKNTESDADILSIISQHIDKQRFSDFKFINGAEAKAFKSITMQDISDDSLNALSGKSDPFPESSAIMYFEKSVLAAENFFIKKQDGDDWYIRS